MLPRVLGQKGGIAAAEFDLERLRDGKKVSQVHPFRDGIQAGKSGPAKGFGFAAVSFLCIGNSFARREKANQPFPCSLSTRAGRGH